MVQDRAMLTIADQ